jgi:hypothetical protein
MYHKINLSEKTIQSNLKKSKALLSYIDIFEKTILKKREDKNESIVGDIIYISKIYNLKKHNRKTELLDSFINGEKIEINEEELKESDKILKYGGSKNKFRKIFNSVFPKVSEGCSVVVDIYGGQGGSSVVLDKQMEENGITQLYFNELNTTLMQFHKNIKEKPYKVIENLIDIYSEIIELFGTLDIGYYQLKLFHTKKIKEIKILESNRIYNEYTSALFMFLNSVSFNGIYEYDFEKNISKEFSLSSDGSKYLRSIIKSSFDIIERSKFYNKYNTIFLEEDGVELIKKFKKNSSNVLFLIDPPYLELDGEEVGCSFNYGVKENEFNHSELLEIIKGTNYIYNNNRNKLLLKYIQKQKEQNENVNLISINKKSSTSRNDYEVIKTKPFLTEYLLYRNINNKSYMKEIKICG